MTTATESLTVKKYFSNIWESITSIIKGMRITLRYATSVKEVTIQYPEEREELPANARMRLYNNVDDCIACTQCAKACPVDCIYIASTRRAKDAPEKVASDGTKIRLDLTQYTIDIGLCCFCGLCTTVCPTECLTHTTNYEFSTYDIKDHKYDFLAPEMIALKDGIIAEQKRLKEKEAAEG